MKKTLNIITFILIVVVLFSLLTLAAYSVNGQTGSDKVQLTGGQFTIQKSVVAGGGGKTGDRLTSTNATAGQSFAGCQLIGGQFKLYSGFWTAGDLALPGGLSLNRGPGQNSWDDR